MNEISRLQKELIGLSLDEARLIHSRIRVRMKNGKGVIGTADVVSDRLNVDIEDNVIVGIIGFG